MATPEAVIHLLAAQRDQAGLLVAIDGQSAAGKSTLARAVHQQLPNVTIIHADDFYRVINEDVRAALDAKGGYVSYYDWQRLESQVLLPLSQGRTAQYQRYNWSLNRLDQWVVVEPTGIIIVEGVYTTRPELRSYYHLKIFLSTSYTTRMLRQEQRCDPSAWIQRWDAAEVYYLQQHNPAAVADIVVGEEAELYDL